MAGWKELVTYVQPERQSSWSVTALLSALKLERYSMEN